MEDTSSPVASQTLSLPAALWQCRLETTLITLLNAQPSSTSRQLVDSTSDESTLPVESDLVEQLRDTATLTPTGSFRHYVYRLKPSAVGRYFDLYVAGRRTSCAALAENIAERRGVLDERFSGVRVSLLVAENFRAETKRAVKDQMGYCLLEAIYFYNQLALTRSKENQLGLIRTKESGITK